MEFQLIDTPSSVKFASNKGNDDFKVRYRKQDHFLTKLQKFFLSKNERQLAGTPLNMINQEQWKCDVKNSYFGEGNYIS